MKPQPKKMLLWLLLALVPATAAVLAVRHPGNVAQTRPGHPEPDLRTRRYPRRGNATVFRQRIERTISSLKTYGKAWRLVQTAPTPGGGFTVKAEVPVLFFTDDLQVQVRPDPTNADWLVDVVSRSRTGKSDLGENRRHVVQLLASLDRGADP